jgi:hypothetical protein
MSAAMIVPTSTSMAIERRIIDPIVFMIKA